MDGQATDGRQAHRFIPQTFRSGIKTVQIIPSPFINLSIMKIAYVVANILTVKYLSGTQEIQKYPRDVKQSVRSFVFVFCGQVPLCTNFWTVWILKVRKEITVNDYLQF